MFRYFWLVACTKSLVIYNSVAHLNQHYNKDEYGKLGHGSAVGGYMIMLSAVVRWCCCSCWRALTDTANPGESRLYTAHTVRDIDRQALAMLAVKGAYVVYCTFLQYAHTFIPVFQLTLISSAGIGLNCLSKLRTNFIYLQSMFFKIYPFQKVLTKIVRKVIYKELPL